jgi:hypothetical protein
MINETDLNNKHQLVSCNIVKKSNIKGAGYGVFAGKDYNEGDVVDKCVYIEIVDNDKQKAQAPVTTAIAEMATRARTVNLDNKGIDDAGLAVLAAECNTLRSEMAGLKSALSDISNYKRKELDDYVFKSHHNKNNEILVFGNGSLYNHSDAYNLQHVGRSDKIHKRVMQYCAVKPIKKGEELYINYGEGWLKKRGL